MARWIASLGFCAGLLVHSGCGDDDDDDTGGPDDSGVDAATDAAVDAATDAGVDAATDAGEDAGPICGRLARERIASDLRWPVYATARPGEDRIYYLERLDGRVVILDATGTPLPEAFLDVAEQMDLSDFEMGLLGFAFHPQYDANGFVYVSFTSRVDTLSVVRFTVPPETPDAVDPESQTSVIEIPTPVHHNVGGVLEFGPDGLLYIGVGDNLEEVYGQDLGVLNGKILRIDVDDPDEPYGIPPDNPFVGLKGALPEIWAYGLREPYRIDFDDETGDLYVTDVGEDLYEEVMVVPGGSPGGQNFGWAIMEGPVCHTPREGCDETGIVLPTYAYSHDEGIAVIGASVYRGTALPECWQGRYFFGDYQPSGSWVRTLRWDLAGGAQEVEQHDGLMVENEEVISFGLDGQGEILIIGEETIDRIVAADE